MPAATPLPLPQVHALAHRFGPGEDLKQAMAALLRARGTGAAVILGAVGSLDGVHLRYADRDEATVLAGRWEILSLSGTLGPGGMHVHLAVSDGEGQCRGGHLLDGCRVYTTAEVVFGEIPGLVFARRPDPRTGYLELAVEASAAPTGSVPPQPGHNTVPHEASMAPTLHLLTRRHPDNHTEVLAWHEDRALLEAEALRLEWQAYEQAIALAGCGSIPVSSPDHTRERMYVVTAAARYDPAETNGSC